MAARKDKLALVSKAKVNNKVKVETTRKSDGETVTSVIVKNFCEPNVEQLAKFGFCTIENLDAEVIGTVQSAMRSWGNSQPKLFPNGAATSIDKTAGKLTLKVKGFTK